MSDQCPHCHVDFDAGYEAHLFQHRVCWRLEQNRLRELFKETTGQVRRTYCEKDCGRVIYYPAGQPPCPQCQPCVALKSTEERQAIPCQWCRLPYLPRRGQRYCCPLCRHAAGSKRWYGKYREREQIAARRRYRERQQVGTPQAEVSPV